MLTDAIARRSHFRPGGGGRQHRRHKPTGRGFLCERGVAPLDQRRLDRSGKKKAISVRAVSSESEPCTEFASIDSAKSLRMVPGAALAGSVAPMISRLRATALSP